MSARECFAIVAPGFEEVVAAELRAIGAATPEVTPGGVGFHGGDALLFEANLRLRAASRVIVRIASFQAKSFAELERRAKTIPWKEFVRPSTRAAFRVTCRKSKLYHSSAVAERLATSLTGSVKGVTVDRPSPDEEGEAEHAPAQLFIVRFDRDECTISADASGVLLHRRGYRLATAKAPMRETIAAGCLLALGYDGSAPLMDPMCGSGTIPIEAAMIARRIAPGMNRAFACEKWPAFNTKAVVESRRAAKAAELPKAPHAILASDRDAGAIEATNANARRVSVRADLTLSMRALSAMEPREGTGLLLTNPPYGSRIGEAAALRNLYAALGNAARKELPGWRVAMISANQQLEGQTKLPLRSLLSFSNGGIKVRLVATT
jgi:putative N6-adenine-specific DNA methylase